MASLGPAPLGTGLVQRASENPGSLSPADVIALQRLVGNRAVQRLLDASARRSVRRESGEEDETAQRASDPGQMRGGPVEDATADSIQRSRGGGLPLPGVVRGSMEKAFGADFRPVRVHTGAESETLNRSLSAKAFTVGSDIFFGRGAYSPGTSDGRRLLAHELTHVVQQGGSQPAAQRKLTVGPAEDAYEQEADRVAQQLPAQPAGLQRRPQISQIRAAPPAAVQRMSAEKKEEVRAKLKEALTPHKYDRLKSNYFVEQPALVEQILEKKDAINGMDNGEFDALSRNADMKAKIESLAGPGRWETLRSWIGWGGVSAQGEGERPVRQRDMGEDTRGEWSETDEEEEKEPPFELTKVEINLLDPDDWQFEKEGLGYGKTSGKAGLKGSLDLEKLKQGNLEGLEAEGVGEIAFQFGKESKPKEGTLDYNWRGNGLAARGKLEGFAGGRAGAQAKAKASYSRETGLQAGVKGKASAFLGASLESSAKVELRVGGDKIVSTEGKLGLAVGVGGEYQGKIQFKGGKLSIGGKGKLAAGLGFSFGYELELDTVGLGARVFRWLKSWIW